MAREGKRRDEAAPYQTERYYPVAVAGAMFSVGDPHASQGDSELCGTAIECSLTGTFQFILHQKASQAEAISLMSIAVDFGITQVVDGNWGVHAVVKKSIFPARGG